MRRQKRYSSWDNAVKVEEEVRAGRGRGIGGGGRRTGGIVVDMEIDLARTLLSSWKCDQGKLEELSILDGKLKGEEFEGR